MDTINAHMLSYTNTCGFKFGIPNLIQQMAITEKVCILKPNRLEGISQKENKEKKRSWVTGGRFIR